MSPQYSYSRWWLNQSTHLLNVLLDDDHWGGAVVDAADVGMVWSV